MRHELMLHERLHFSARVSLTRFDDERIQRVVEVEARTPQHVATINWPVESEAVVTSWGRSVLVELDWRSLSRCDGGEGGKQG